MDCLFRNGDLFPVIRGYTPYDEGDAYLLQNGIHTVFAATIRPEDYEKAKEIMFFITKKLGGYFCADTADFKPIVAAK